MDPARLKSLLEKYRSGQVDTDAVLDELKRLPFDDLGFARIDQHRGLRRGFPEVVFCQSKTADQVRAIAESLLRAGHNLLATRATPDHFEAVKAVAADAEYNPTARTILVKRSDRPSSPGTVAVITAGTADIPVGEEARVTAEAMGTRVRTYYDVGVAGLHRILACAGDLQSVAAAVVAAGMEGALASVVGGMIPAPVIAVPTSIGYGASFGGIAALLAMLNSCAAGVSVVNIDNGFGAGYIAALIARGVTPGPPQAAADPCAEAEPE